MFYRLKLNADCIIKKTLKISGFLFGIATILLAFISWDNLGITNVCSRIAILIAILVFSLIISSIYILCIKKSYTVWECGTGKIIVRYSDIINEGFKKNIKNEKIIVIPVNTCFDTIIDSDISTSSKPLVSPKTIHGQWIKSMNDIGISSETLNNKIENYLNEKNIKPVKKLSREVKRQGNLLSYKYGTIVPIRGNENVTFYLLALSEFDKNNTAQSSVDTIIECIQKLVKFYNINGQGFDMYLPLMGTNLSRAGMSHSESLQKTKSVLELYNNQIHGSINIVIYYKDKNKVTLSS